MISHFYDTLLDSAALFNIIPSRYKELNLSDLDTYFAMSRGYQGDHGDVRALAMKKWFNTNYHYMVPEIEDDTEIKLTGTKLFDEFHEALHLGIFNKTCDHRTIYFIKINSIYWGKTTS